MRILKDFVHSFDFVRMKPDPSAVAAPEELAAQALVEKGRQDAVYLHARRIPRKAVAVPAEIGLDLPAGRYRVEWVDPKTGKALRDESLEHTGGRKSLTSPAFDEDLALAVRTR